MNKLTHEREWELFQRLVLQAEKTQVIRSPDRDGLDRLALLASEACNSFADQVEANDEE